MKELKIIFIIFFVAIKGFLFGQDFPSSYKPDLTRVIEANPAPLLKITGEYGVWYKTVSKFEDDRDRNQITRPFIMCEGFDLINNLGLEELYDQLNDNARISSNLTVTDAGFLDDLRCAGYDVIILNLNSNTKAIEENAELFIKLIKEIDDEVKSNATNNGTFYSRAVVGGISMGGLVSRLSLTDASIYTKQFSSQEEIPVETYFSFDSPHNGANIPLGLHHLANVIPGSSSLSAITQINALLPAELNQLNPFFQLEQRLTSKLDIPYLISPSAQQMAITYGISPYPLVLTSNPARTIFENRLINNGMPLCRTVGVSCGSSQINQEGINPGEPIFEISNGGACLVDRDINLPLNLGSFHLRFCPLTFGLGAWAMPGKSGLVFDKTAEFGVGAQISFNNTELSTYLYQRFSYERDLLSSPSDRNVDHVPGAHLPSITSGLGTVCHWVNEEIDVPVRIEFDISMRPLGKVKPVCWKFWKSKCWGYLDDIEVDMDLGTWRRPLGNCDNADNFTFVPTASALAIKDKNWHTNFDDIGNYPQNDVDTEFDAIYWDRYVNHNHAYMANDAMAAFVETEIAPLNLFIQDRIFDDGYRNTFISDGYIAIGNSVDLTTNRQEQGDVILKNTEQILFVVPDDQFVYFDNGFDASNLTNGEIEVITYPSNRACTNSKRGTNLQNLNPSSSWASLRPSEVASTKLSREVVDNFTGLIPSNEKPVYTFSGLDYSENEINQLYYGLGETKSADKDIDISCYPNPVTDFGSTKVNITLIEEETITIEIKDENGKLIVTPISNMTLPPGDVELDFDNINIKDGIYFIHVKSKEEILGVNKIIVLRK